MVEIELDLKDDAEIISEIAQVLKKHNKLPPTNYQIRQVILCYKLLPEVVAPTPQPTPTPEPEPEPKFELDLKFVRVRELLRKDTLTPEEMKELNELMT